MAVSRDFWVLFVGVLVRTAPPSKSRVCIRAPDFESLCTWSHWVRWEGWRLGEASCAITLVCWGPHRL